MKTSPRDETGAVAILVAVMAGVLFVTAALVIDLGLARDTRRQSQNAADASALAAGNKLYTSAGVVDFATAISEAQNYALRNFQVPLSAWGTCTDSGKLSVPSAPTDCISFDHATKPTLVRVKIPTRDVVTGLGSLTGVQRIPVDAMARAALTPATRVECSLCVVGSIPHTIGNGDISVLTVTGGGGIHLNGSLSGQANSNVTAPAGITIEGTWSSSPDYDPEPVQGPRIGDPFASATLPTNFAALGAAKSNPCTGGPGLYTSYEVGSNATCTLTPGLYVFTGKLSLKNTSELLGTGVSLYFTCGTGTNPRACAAGGEQGGQFDATNGEVGIGAGAPPIANMVVAYDRKNTSPLTLQGNGDSVLTGNVYALGALLYANGNACHTIKSGAIIVNDIYLNGNPSCLQIQAGIPAVYIAPPSQLRLDQ